jgi:threonine synthase
VSVRYACVSCGTSVETDDVIYQCPRCAWQAGGAPGQGFRRGNLVTIFEPKAALRPGLPADPLSFLPLPVVGIAGFPVGNTPLVEPRFLRERTGFPKLSIKYDAANPSGSLKDRASLLVAAQAVHHGQRRVALASTGNAGASMACAGAACGLEVILFVPAAAPPAKLLQALLYGARVVPVEGSYDDAFSLSIGYTEAHGGINRNTGYNPFTIEGKKTVSVEIYNQLGCDVPDIIYVPTGDGVIISGVWKGFTDLQKAGLAEKLPVMVAVQAEGSNAIARSLKEGHQISLSRAVTIADSLAVASPANGEMALECLRASGGRAVEVSDAEIRRAQAELCNQGGMFVEPSSAAAWAGFLNDRENVDRDARVVVLLTGTGFKDIRAVEKLVSVPEPCPPILSEAARLLERVYGVG